MTDVAGEGMRVEGEVMSELGADVVVLTSE